MNCRLLRDIYENEFKDAYANTGKMVRTPVGFHVDNCPGCMDVYFSREKQELVAICNECGMKRQFLTNIEGNYGSILGCTIPFSEAYSEDHNKKQI